MNMSELERSARFNLKAFEDIMLYGTIRDQTLQGQPGFMKKVLKGIYEKVYSEWQPED